LARAGCRGGENRLSYEHGQKLSWIVAHPSADDDPTSRAFADIRLAEAARLLGLLSADPLDARATEWLAAGIDTANVQALAQSPRDAAGIRLALVAEIADEFGIRFARLQDARRLYSDHILRSLSGGAVASGEIAALSNGYTDEIVARIRGFLGGLLRRHS
jgi:hypothetical protein